MESSDIKIIVIGFVVVVVLFLFMFLTPIYVMPDFSSERHFRWNPPVRKVPNVYSKLTPAEIESFNSDPFRKQMLEVMKNQPSEVPAPPVYFGSMSVGFNIIGYAAILSLLGWLGFSGYKIVKYILKVRKEAMENPW